MLSSGKFPSNPYSYALVALQYEKASTAVVLNRGTRLTRGINKFPGDVRPYALYNMEKLINLICK